MLTSRLTTGRTTSRATGWSRTRTALLAGGALAAAAVLGGCSGTPGAAATVDGRVIAASDVQVAVEQLSGLFNPVDAQTITSLLAVEPTISAIAAENGVGVSDAQARELLEQASAAAGLPVRDEFAASTIAVARFVEARGAIADRPDAQQLADEFNERISELDIDVNPRFGTLAEAGNIDPPTLRSWVVGATAES